MILCVCLSPAVDLTYRTDEFVVGATNRVREVLSRPGGKAVNVARVLHALGEPTQVLLPLGGDTGDDVARGLAALGIATSVVASGRATRRTVTVVDGASGSATVLVEPALVDCWPEMVRVFLSLLAAAEVIVLIGAVPSGAPEDAMSALVGLAKAAGLPVLVDTSGEALVDALFAGPTAVKPNADELAQVSPGSDPLKAARALAEKYATTVVASLGSDGVVAATSDSAWVASPAAVLEGNPTGAGDAMVAGLARALRADPGMTDLAEALRDCVALAAAAVLSPVAGEVDMETYAVQRQGVVVRELGGVSG